MTIKHKLALKTETLRSLTPDAMHAVRGGVNGGNFNTAEAVDVFRQRPIGTCVPGCTRGGVKTEEAFKTFQLGGVRE